MKALSLLRSAIDHGTIASAIALVSLVSVIYPEIGLASSLQTGEENALVVEIKDPASVLTPKPQEKLAEITATTSDTSLTYDQVINNDPLVNNLREYLNSYGSPLAVYADQIVQQPNWQKALAISFVESNMGKYCADNNCSGIGVAPGHPSWRKYDTKLDWFKDLCQLLDKPIYQKYNTFEKMKGVYVQPGSAQWVNGAKKIYAELMTVEEQSNQQRVAMQQPHTVTIAAVEQEAQLAVLKK